jgi:NAD(P)-dependent dehydrogenase (short-subunit alcohol dehydrogenase family)|tara:strand:- start:895 stop:1557 length:663 start_codon:yes stop_codon:yes gene_type:complete
MKIAITGHSSGIGQGLDTALSLTEPDWEIRGYSKSNGHNIAEDNGDKIIQTLIDYDPDVLFNNAYYPKMQNKICETLYAEWSDKPKVIINTGSISGYLAEMLGDGESDYINDKQSMSHFCIVSSFNYPRTNKTRLHNISFGFVDTPLVTNTTKEVNKANMISTDDAIFMLIDLIDEKPQHIVEQVVNCNFTDVNEMQNHFQVATRNVLKHIVRSNKQLKG